MDRRSKGSRESFDDRANHILDAATRVIAREGYQKASMRAVAREAEVSLAGIYHYFESKERMLFTIQFRTFSTLLSNLREKLHGTDCPVEQLHIMVYAHVSHFSKNLDALKTCTHEMESLNGAYYEEIRAVRYEYYEATRSILDRILNDPPDPPDSPDAANAHQSVDRHIATMALFGTLNWLYQWYDPARDGSPARLARRLSTQFLNGICPAEHTVGV